MIASVIGAMIALATKNLWLAVMAGMGFYYCFKRYQFAKYEGDEFDESDGTDYSAAYDINIGRPKKKSKRQNQRIEKLRQEEAAERLQIDAILEKVSAKGMHSLSRSEKRILQKATERQRQRDVQLGRRVS